jgi:hypothetical protein
MCQGVQTATYTQLPKNNCVDSPIGARYVILLFGLSRTMTKINKKIQLRIFNAAITVKQIMTEQK